LTKNCTVLYVTFIGKGSGLSCLMYFFTELTMVCNACVSCPKSFLKNNARLLCVDPDLPTFYKDVLLGKFVKKI